MSPNGVIRDYLSGSNPRMHSFEAVSWISCSSFKHCAMVPEIALAATRLDDDALAKTRLRLPGGATPWPNYGGHEFFPLRGVFSAHKMPRQSCWWNKEKSNLRNRPSLRRVHCSSARYPWR